MFVRRQRYCDQPAGPVTRGRRSHQLLPCALAVVVVLLWCGPAGAELEQRPSTPLNVLLVGSWFPDMPLHKTFRDGLSAGLDAAGVRHRLFVESLDASRFPVARQRGLMLHTLREKYRDFPLAAVVAESVPAVSLMRSYPDLLPGVPRVLFQTGGEADDIPPGDVVLADANFERSLEEIIRLVAPNTIYLVNETITQRGRRRTEQFNAAVERVLPDRGVEFLSNLSMEKLLDQVAQLPDNSAIFFLPMFRGLDDFPITPKAASGMIAARANAPVFSAWETLLGDGVIGGHMLSIEKMGRAAAQSIVELHGGTPTDAAVSLHGLYYDWRQLQRWGIDEARLLPGTTVLYRESSVIERYTVHLVTVAVIVVILILLIALLIKKNLLQKQLEGVMRNAQKELEETVTQRTRALEQAMREAERANEVKSEFLASMSHEIRTPMTAVMGIADMLLRAGLPDESTKKIGKIKEATRSLLTILNDILDISKMSAGKLQIEYVDTHLPSLIEDVAVLFQAKVQVDRGTPVALSVDLADDFPTGARLDPTRFRQILVNLVGNAVKFTSEGSVTIAGSLEHPADGAPRILIEVRDTGIGIADGAISKLFGDFVQADSSITREFEGTGLGLAICKRLVELLGGEIGADSAVGVGSTFWFTVPYEPATGDVVPGPATAGPAPTYKARRPLHILVAEDNPLNQQIIVAIVEGFGHDVEAANNGMEMVRKHLDDDYDLILSDIRMPLLSGVDATKMIRAVDNEKADVPIIALTADVMEESKKSYVGAGMNGIVSKPIEPAELVGEIDTVLGEKLHEAIWSDGDNPDNPPPVIVAEAENFSAAIAAERLGLPKPAVDKLLLSFAERYGGVCDQIREELTQDRDVAHRTAHSLKGLSGTLRMQGVFERVQAVEEAIERDDDGEAEAAIRELERILPGVIDDIHENIRP